MSDALFDPGLQPERTHLAWRRTSLAIAVGSVAALRIVPDALGSVAGYAPGVLGVAVATWMWGMAKRRHRAFARQVGADEDPMVAGAAPLLVVAGFASAVGVAALLIVGAAR